MPRKTKASPEEKAQIVEAYLRGEMGLKSAAAKLSVVISTIELWIALYRAEGSNAFVQAKRNRYYSPEVKEAAVKEYLFGKDSILHHITMASDGMDQGKNKSLIYFVPQISDVDIDNIGVVVKIVIPHMVRDLASAQNMPLIAKKILEQGIFP